MYEIVSNASEKARNGYNATSVELECVQFWDQIDDCQQSPIFTSNGASRVNSIQESVRSNCEGFNSVTIDLNDLRLPLFFSSCNSYPVPELLH